MEEMRDERMEQEQEARNTAMAPHIDSIGADGIYEVIDEISH
jgi:hypothetical protein